MVTIDAERYIGEILKKYRADDISPSEDIMRFLVGYYLADDGSDMVFEVGRISTDMAFSPDVDVLEMTGESLIGYEIKGVRDGEVSKDQLYTGLGQAIALLAQPCIFEDRMGLGELTPVISKSYLVYPSGKISASQGWLDSFLVAVRRSPIGLATMSPEDGLTVHVAAEEYIPDGCRNLSGRAKEECMRQPHDKIRGLLRREGSGTKNPDTALERAALEIAKQRNMIM